MHCGKVQLLFLCIVERSSYYSTLMERYSFIFMWKCLEFKEPAVGARRRLAQGVHERGDLSVGQAL